MSERARCGRCGAQAETTRRAKSADDKDTPFGRHEAIAVSTSSATGAALIPSVVLLTERTQVVDPLCDTSSVRLDQAHREEARQIALELARLARSGRILPGSIVERQMVCGYEGCACHADPPRKHGPYYQWTRKVANKTVGRFLSKEQRDDYQLWLHNGRRARALVSRLEELGVAAMEADPRSSRSR